MMNRDDDVKSLKTCAISRDCKKCACFGKVDCNALEMEAAKLIERLTEENRELKRMTADLKAEIERSKK